MSASGLRPGALRERVTELAGEREADHQGAAALEHVAARGNEMYVHGSLLHAMPAARLTARDDARMRTAATEIVGERLLDIGVARLLVGREEAPPIP